MHDPSSKLVDLEVCVDRIDAALAAEEAGATRIELNAALVEDGLTPSHGVCEAVCAAARVPIIAMVRPHNDGFVYSATERASMIRDVRSLLHITDGIAIGALTTTGDLDTDLLQSVAAVREEVAQSRQIAPSRLALVMHRAFDFSADLPRALEQLVELGFDRVLTSGGASTAVAGAEMLKQLIERAAGRIEILPGCGVRADNAAELAIQTGATQLHGSFRIAQAPFVDIEQIGRVAKLIAT
ncbi:MAG: copper homeostasis protein CutC [Aureliella sp.]